MLSGSVFHGFSLMIFCTRDDSVHVNPCLRFLFSILLRHFSLRIVSLIFCWCLLLSCGSQLVDLIFKQHQTEVFLPRDDRMLGWLFLGLLKRIWIRQPGRTSGGKGYAVRIVGWILLHYLLLFLSFTNNLKSSSFQRVFPLPFRWISWWRWWRWRRQRKRRVSSLVATAARIKDDEI